MGNHNSKSNSARIQTSQANISLMLFGRNAENMYFTETWIWIGERNLANNQITTGIEKDEHWEEQTNISKMSSWHKTWKEYIQRFLKSYFYYYSISGLSIWENLSRPIDQNMRRLQNAPYEKTVESLFPNQDMVHEQLKLGVVIILEQPHKNLQLPNTADTICTQITTTCTLGYNEELFNFLNQLSCFIELHGMDIIADNDQFPCTRKENIGRKQSIKEQCPQFAEYDKSLGLTNIPEMSTDSPHLEKRIDNVKENREQNDVVPKENIPHCFLKPQNIESNKNSSSWNFSKLDRELVESCTYQQERDNNTTENFIEENTPSYAENITNIVSKRKEPDLNEKLEENGSNKDLSNKISKAPVMLKKTSPSSMYDEHKPQIKPCPKDPSVYSNPEEDNRCWRTSQTSQIADKRKNVTEISTTDDYSSPSLKCQLYNPDNFESIKGQLRSSYDEIEAYTLMYLRNVVKNPDKEMAVFTDKSRQSFVIFHSGVQVIDTYICVSGTNPSESFPIDDCRFTLMHVSLILLEIYVITIALETFNHARAIEELEKRGKNSIDILMKEVKLLKSGTRFSKGIPFKMVRELLMELAYAMPPRGETIMKHCMFEAVQSKDPQQDKKVSDLEPRACATQNSPPLGQEAYDDAEISRKYTGASQGIEQQCCKQEHNLEPASPDLASSEKSRKNTSKEIEKQCIIPTLELESGNVQDQKNNSDLLPSPLPSPPLWQSSFLDTRETNVVQESVSEIQQFETENHETITDTPTVSGVNQQPQEEFLKEILDQTVSDVSIVHKSIAARYNVTLSQPLLERYLRESNKNVQELCQNLTLLCGESFTAWEAQGDSFPLSECKDILLEVGKECLQVCFDSLAKQFFHRLTPDRTTDVEASVARMCRALTRDPFQIEPSTAGHASADSMTMVQLGESLRTRAQEPQGEDVFAGTEITRVNVPQISPEDLENNLAVTVEKK